MEYKRCVCSRFLISKRGRTVLLNKLELNFIIKLKIKWVLVKYVAEERS